MCTPIACGLIKKFASNLLFHVRYPKMYYLPSSMIKRSYFILGESLSYWIWQTYIQYGMRELAVSHERWNVVIPWNIYAVGNGTYHHALPTLVNEIRITLYSMRSLLRPVHSRFVCFYKSLSNNEYFHGDPNWKEQSWERDRTLSSLYIIIIISKILLVCSRHQLEFNAQGSSLKNIRKDLAYLMTQKCETKTSRANFCPEYIKKCE